MTIFVGGVHGAGKTFIAKPACEALKRPYATASQLIRERRGTTSWSSEKVVSDVESNQQALIEAVLEINASGTPLVLDGHFVLRTAPGAHEEIPVSVFAALQCRAIILIECPVSVLTERIASRGDLSWTVDEIQRFREAERKHAEHVSEELNIRMVRLESPESATLETLLRCL